MEKRYQHTVDGQSVLQGDLNTMAEAGALADDRVFAELFRLRPFDGSSSAKGILPFGHGTSGRSGLIATNGASGSVLVNPFRALVGSRTAVATDAKKNHRDIRSGIGVGSTTLAQTVAFADNASGDPRWDLIVAVVAVDANAAAVERKVKDPTTKAIAAQNIVTVVETTVSLDVVAGTANAAPEWPAVPSDSGGTYYIPLAYVRIPDGFDSTATVGADDICVAAPCLAPNSKSGAVGGGFANQQAIMSTAQQQDWGATGNRPNRYLPSSMQGGERLWVYIDTFDGSSANWSHQDDDVVDDRDWRGRICMWTATLTVGAGPGWNAGGGTWPGSSAIFEHTVGTGVLTGFGSSMQQGGPSAEVIVDLPGNQVGAITDTEGYQLYVDGNDGGKLKIAYTNAPNAHLLVCIDFTGPFENAY